MYQALLTRRYLTSKVMPLLSAVAVLLCTAMVLTVWSVMTGFLNMLLESGQTLMGDAIISSPVRGMPYYEDLMARLVADDAAVAATPTIEAPGLLGLPDGRVQMVSVVGVEGESYDRVTGFADALWWQHLDRPLPRDTEGQDLRLRIEPGHRLEREGESLTRTDLETQETEPGIVAGVWVSDYNRRTSGGWVDPAYGFLPSPAERVTLSVLPLSAGGAAVSVEARSFPVVNEFQTGLYEVDRNTILLRLDALQEMLGMDAAARIEGAGELRIDVNEAGEEVFVRPEVVGESPARATSVLVRAAEGVTAHELAARAREIYAEFAAARGDDVPDPRFVQIYTWEERPGVRTLIAAVKKETGLTLVLFGFISITAVFLVFAIFWAMVTDKTKDIGILRSMGASRLGVAWIFLRYGVAIGVVGALLGGALAYAIVLNINPIHEWLGQALGIYVWDPSIYYFTEIPSRVETSKAIIVMACGVLFSVAGALVPAIKAANMDPVRALRFE